MVVLDDPQAFGGLQGLHGLQENLATSNVLYGLPHISLLILEQLEKLKCSSYTASEELYLSCKKEALFANKPSKLFPFEPFDQLLS